MYNDASNKNGNIDHFLSNNVSIASGGNKVITSNTNTCGEVGIEESESNNTTNKSKKDRNGDCNSSHYVSVAEGIRIGEDKVISLQTKTS